MDIGNHRYTNVQNCIRLKTKCDTKNCAPNPHPVTTALKVNDVI